jgi:hypothetical protein
MTVGEIQQLVGPTFADTFHNEVEKVLEPLRKYIDQGRPPSMGKEIWEYLVTDSIVGAEWCGAGKGIADVRIGESIADVKSLQCERTTTTEASLHQKLLKKDSAEYYATFDIAYLWNLLVGGWLEKVNSVKQYYLLAIIRDKKTLQCSLIGFRKLDVNPIFDLAKCTLSKKQASVAVNSLADPKLVQIKLYRGKTRMEIRFKKAVFANPKYSLPIYKGII